MISRENCIFLDSLRQKKNIKLIDFIDEIVSLRQYKRYLYGDSEMPYKIFVLLAERLQFNPTEVLRQIEQTKFKQLEHINYYYNAVNDHNFDRAEKLMTALPLKDIIDNKHKNYYEISYFMYQYLTNKSTKMYVKSKIAELLNYPTILEFEVLDIVEIMGLCIFLSYCDTHDKKMIIDKLYTIINDQEKQYLGNTFFMEQYVLLRLAKEHGIMGQDDKVLLICEQAIKKAKQKFSFFNLEYYYYYCAIAYRNLKQIEKAHEYLILCYHVVKLQKADKLYNRFHEMIKKDFHMNWIDLIRVKEYNNK